MSEYFASISKVATVAISAYSRASSPTKNVDLMFEMPQSPKATGSPAGLAIAAPTMTSIPLISNVFSKGISGLSSESNTHQDLASKHLIKGDIQEDLDIFGISSTANSNSKPIDFGIFRSNRNDLNVLQSNPSTPLDLLASSPTQEETISNIANNAVSKAPFSFDFFASIPAPTQDILAVNPIITSEYNSRHMHNKSEPDFLLPTVKSKGDTDPSESLKNETELNGSLEKDAEMDRLKKFEERFIDLEKAFKGLKGKYTTLEDIISRNTPVGSLMQTDSLTSLESYLRVAKSNQDAGEELKQMANQISAMKHAKDDEAQTHADMFAACQQKLITREEEINGLKRQIRKLEGLTTPSSEGGTTPNIPRKSFSRENEFRKSGIFSDASPSIIKQASDNESLNSDSLTFKLKIKELSNNLLNVTKERDDARDKLQTIEVELLEQKSSGKNSNEHVLDETKSKKIDDLELKINTLTYKLEEATNSDLMLQGLTKSLRKENDILQDEKTQLQEQNLELSAMSKDLREQVSSMFDDMSSLADESEKLKHQINELTEANKSNLSSESSRAIDLVKKEYTDRQVSLEFRLNGLQQKLDQSDVEKSKLEKKIKEQLKSIQDLRKSNDLVQVPLLDPQDLKNEKLLVEALQKENQTLKQSVTKNLKEVTSYQSEIENITKTHQLAVSEWKSKVDHLKSLLQAEQSQNKVRKRLSDLNQVSNSLKDKMEARLEAVKAEGHDSDGIVDQEIASLKIEIEALQKENVKLQEQLDSDTEVKTLKEQLDSKDEILKKSSDNISILSEKLKLLESDDLPSLINKLKSEKVTLETDLEKANLLQAELEVQIANLQKELKIKQDNDIKILQLQTEVQKLDNMIKEKEKGMSELADQVFKFREKLVAEEEKKTKSINLLRQSKAKIIKLEGDLKSAQEQLKGSSSLSKEMENLLIQNQNKIENIRKLETTINQSETIIQNLRKDLESEKEHHFKTYTSLNDKEQKLKIMELRECELNANNIKEIEALKKENETLIYQFDEWNSKVHDHDSSIEALEQDLEVSKRLFQTKSIENDSLKLRISELEGEIYEQREKVGNHSETLNMHIREAEDAKLRLNDCKAEVTLLKNQINELKEKYSEEIQQFGTISNEKNRYVSEINSLKEALKEIEEKDKDSSTELSETKMRLIEMEEKFKNAVKEKIMLSNERESLLSDFRTREMQLKNLNKSLKDECRKLGASIDSADSSAASSPAPIRGQKTLSKSHPTRGSISSETPPPLAPRKGSFLSSSAIIERELDQPLNPAYLKAVLLKFLESRDKRSQLIGVIGMLLKFTPEEVKRAAKSI